jgi:hypothetical protein
MLLCGMSTGAFADFVRSIFRKKEPKPVCKRYSYADEVSDSDLTTIRVARVARVKRVRSPSQN